MKQKWLAVGIILLFLGTCILPGIAQETEKPLQTSRGTWLYVGGSGPGNYSRIQDAIDNASDGDTVFVYHGVYYETLSITSSITVKAEDVTTTFIVDNFDVANCVILIDADSVVLVGFTIIANGTNTDSFYCAIKIVKDSSVISNNNIESVNYALVIISDYNTIVNNHIDSKIFITAGPQYNVIQNNTINGYVNFVYGVKNDIVDNDFYNSYLYFMDGAENNITDNTFRNGGISLGASWEGFILHNNTVNGKPIVYLNEMSNKTVDYPAGQILLNSCENITITNQNFSDVIVGIQVYKSENCQIIENTMDANELTNLLGIDIKNSEHIMIMDNEIKNIFGIALTSSNEINISRNSLIDVSQALEIHDCDKVTVSNNTMKRKNGYCTIGLSRSQNCRFYFNNFYGYRSFLFDTNQNCTVCYNNFFNIFLQARFYDDNFNSDNTWYRNYWGRTRFLPKPIPGFVIIPKDPIPRTYFWLHFDFFPAQRPYDIPGMS